MISLVVSSLAPPTLYAGTGSSGVFKSTDSGASWVAKNAGLTNLGVAVLAIDPSHPATVYAGDISGNFFKSTDSGESWFTATPLPRGRVTSLLAYSVGFPAG